MADSWEDLLNDDTDVKLIIADNKNETKKFLDDVWDDSVEFVESQPEIKIINQPNNKTNSVKVNSKKKEERPKIQKPVKLKQVKIKSTRENDPLADDFDEDELDCIRIEDRYL